jgi:hypothetical protein
MSDTPETDALISVGLENADRECVPAEFGRKLERERDEAREDLEFRRGLYRVQEECLENAREQIKELIYIAERAIALADIDFENDKFGVVSELRSDLDKIKEETK